MSYHSGVSRPPSRHPFLENTPLAILQFFYFIFYFQDRLYWILSSLRETTPIARTNFRWPLRATCV
jgi:hypothetical protein